MQSEKPASFFAKKFELLRKNRVIILISAAFFFGGIVFWGAFNTAMEATNTLSFCISCHEMRDTVYQEYKQSVHYSNRTGVRAACPDCHVPHAWIPKIIRKIQASNEIYHKLIGTIDTPEKFEEHRLELAQHVWDTMKKTDSRECKNCHSFEVMNVDKQKPRAHGQHASAMTDGGTCIDCHKGIAHKDISKQLLKDGAQPESFDIQ